MLILINYGHNQMIGFREMSGQSWSNLIDGLDTTGLGEIHIQILINRIEEYDDILVLVKFETNWIVRLSKHNHISTQHMSIMRHT